MLCDVMLCYVILRPRTQLAVRTGGGGEAGQHNIILIVYSIPLSYLVHVRKALEISIRISQVHTFNPKTNN